MSRYRAAFINVSVEVESYEDLPTQYTQPQPRRTTKIEFRETFKDDAGLDKAVAALASTILEAARR